MELFLATKTGTPIIGQIAVCDGLDHGRHLQDALTACSESRIIGLCIIIFSILIFALYDSAADQAAEVLQAERESCSRRSDEDPEEISG